MSQWTFGFLVGTVLSTTADIVLAVWLIRTGRVTLNRHGGG